MSLHLPAHQIESAVRKLYAKNGYVVLSQVRNGTGYARPDRTADMLVVSTWPSRGLHAEGIEIKSSRSDLMRELATPEKADEIAKYCRHWWLAVPDGLITADMIVPETWGVITVDDKLKAKHARAARTMDPKPMDTLMVCSVLRNFAECHVSMSEVEPLCEAARKSARESAKIDQQYRLDQLEAAVAKLKETSGIDLLTEYGRPVFNIREIGEAVKLITSLSDRPLSEIAAAKQALSVGISAIDAALKVMDAPLSRAV